MSKSVFGLDEKLAAMLSYPIGPISGLVFFILERENKFVRFHALQATLYGLVYWLAMGILRALPVVRWFLPNLLSLAGGLCTIYLMYMAFRGKTFKLPYIGEAAYNQVHK